MRKTLLLAALAALSFSACQKSSDNPQPTNPGATEKHQLVASVVTDYGNGTNEISYNYDNQNRLTGIHSILTGNANGDIADHVYEYDEQGNLVKSTITRNNDISIFDYTYINGVPTKVSYSQPGNPSQGHIIDITIANSQVSTNAISTPSGESATVNYIYNNNNKTEEVHKGFLPTGNLDFKFTLEDVYGIKKNPYLYSGNKWMLPDVPFANKNELLKETVINDGPVTIITYVNTYNQQGYPTTVDVTMTTESKITKSTITYKYINAK